MGQASLVDVQHQGMSLSCVPQVKSRVAVLNQRHPERTIWKESAICTKTWNSSVLQLIDVRHPPLPLSAC